MSTEPCCDTQPCKMLEQGFVLAGYIDVDAGIVWTGDPCYILPDKRDNDPGFDYMDMLHTWPRKKHTIEDSGAAEMHRDALIASGVPEDRAEVLCDMFRYRTVDEPTDVAIFNHKAGHPGRGICIHAGFGDGTYPLWIRYSNEGDPWGIRVAEIRTVFIDNTE